MGASTLGMLPPVIRRSLAIPASGSTRSIHDVKHVVILMQENRSFDHYFGTLRGVRGFGDRCLLPLASGKSVWFQSDGDTAVLPFHLDSAVSSALRVPDTPHSFSDTQAAWNQGRFGYWPKFKTAYSMGYYRRADIPFQFAMAEAFTICDAYHCSVTSGTDPNRIVFWSGGSADPRLTTQGINCTDSDSEPDNLRCWVTGKIPQPGYSYQGAPLEWPTIPDVLEQAGVSWRIYQDPNDNYMGAMHGGLAFASFRSAKPGSSLYKNGMSHWSLRQLRTDVQRGALPQVSWILPSQKWCEHPQPSSPTQGAEFTSRVLEALTSNPATWSQTVLFLTFDENDGLFDHVPPPAVPSYNPDGTLAGKSTLDLRGEYFSDPARKHLHPEDNASGTLRPWGLGPRVPMYVISPWSRGGWVNSQVFDHTSVAQFLEKRFGVRVPGISPWHRAICGDLTSAFDFSQSDEFHFPKLPYVTDSDTIIAVNSRLDQPRAPSVPERLFQEPGTRPSRPLPYLLNTHWRILPSGVLSVTFINEGNQGAVLHVYDKLHLDRTPRRYTVEAGRELRDEWDAAREGKYHLWVYGPNGFLRELRVDLSGQGHGTALPVIDVSNDVPAHAVQVVVTNVSTESDPCEFQIQANAYRGADPVRLLVRPGEHHRHVWSVKDTDGWYDFTVTTKTFDFRLAGRLETGRPSTSDPVLAL